MDFDKADKAFKEYLKNYDINEGSIKLKIKNTVEVKKSFIQNNLQLIYFLDIN
jgi:hypothetical protein